MSWQGVIVAAKSAPVLAITVPAVGNASGRLRATAVSKTSAIAVISDPMYDIYAISVLAICICALL